LGYKTLKVTKEVLKSCKKDFELEKNKYATADKVYDKL
jgi:hypothetical protein